MQTRPLLLLILLLYSTAAIAADSSVLEERRAVAERPKAAQLSLPTALDEPRALLVGDSWAQYMWDDASHNDVADRFGFADHQTLSLSLGSDPGPGYTGPEIAISGSEARHWVDTANYPWIANSVALLQANPSIDRVILSIGGNDLLAGSVDGGWYKDMDLDVPGSEEAVFALLETNLDIIVDALIAVRPEIEVILSSYDYPNFDVGFWCFLYACGKREELSRDPGGDLITNTEINALMVEAETRRRAWAASRPRVHYDNSIGLMHHVYGDGLSAAWSLPRPGSVPELYEPFPGGNSAAPTLRANFRQPNGIDADPIHLNFDSYQHKIGQQLLTHLAPYWRDQPTATLPLVATGWTDGLTAVDGGLRVGDDGSNRIAALLDVDLALLPPSRSVEAVSIYLTRVSAIASSPFASGTLGLPSVDIAQPFFGNSSAWEALDLTAAATLSDAAHVVGSAGANGYTLRLEFKQSALALFDSNSALQLRLSFPLADAGSNFVNFTGVEGAAPSNQQVASFSWLNSTTAPTLDIRYDLTTALAPTRPTQARFLSNQPNPFNPRTEIRFELDTASVVELTVVDLRGRYVATLLQGFREPGLHSQLWDGRDDSESFAASGVYLLRLTTATSTVTQKIALVR